MFLFVKNIKTGEGLCRIECSLNWGVDTHARLSVNRSREKHSTYTSMVARSLRACRETNKYPFDVSSAASLFFRFADFSWLHYNWWVWVWDRWSVCLRKKEKKEEGKIYGSNRGRAWHSEAAICLFFKDWVLCLCMHMCTQVLLYPGDWWATLHMAGQLYSCILSWKSPCDRDTLRVSVRKTAAYSNLSCCPSESSSDRNTSHVSVRETAAYSNHSCCPSKSPSDRDNLHEFWRNRCMLKPLMLSQLIAKW